MRASGEDEVGEQREGAAALEAQQGGVALYLGGTDKLDREHGVPRSSRDE
jgi:hypothetical protein